MYRSLKGKIIVNFGDSIFGNFRAPEDISTYLAEATGATVYNVGFGGCRMSEHHLLHFDRFSMYRLAYAVTTRDFALQDESFSYEPIGEGLPGYFKDSLALLESIDFSKVDIITIAYGTNDFTGGRHTDSEDKFDTITFGGALRYSLKILMSAFPHIKIAVCSPTYRFWRDKDGNVTNDSNDMRYHNGTLPDFVTKSEEVSKEYGVLYIDNYNDCGISKENRDLCFSERDGTHPMPYGRRLIAKNLAKELTEAFGE